MPIDLRGVKSATGPLVSGLFPMRIIEGVEGKSEGKGTPYIRFTARFIKGEFEGRKIKRDFWLTPDSYQFLVRLLIALKVDHEREFENTKAIIDECLNKDFIGKVLAKDGSPPELEDTLPA